MIHLILKDVDHLEHYIDQLKSKFSEGPLYLTIDKINDLEYSRKIYFAKIGEFADQLGHTKKEMHEFVKNNVLRKITNQREFLIEPDNNPDLYSTKSLNKAGYTALIRATSEFILNQTDTII